jgi:hypothetical protein
MRAATRAPSVATSCRIAAVLALLVSVVSEPSGAVAAEAGDQAAPTNRVQSLTRSIEQNAPVADASPGAQSDPDAGYAVLRLEEERTRRYVVMGLIGACLLSLVLVLTFLCRSSACTTSALVNGSGLVLVIYATILVVVIARAERQLTAAIGVLGAIIGYLFGPATRAATRAATQVPKPKAPAEERSGAAS